MRFDRQYLRRLMTDHRGNVSRAAQEAGKERRDLGKLLKRTGSIRESSRWSGWASLPTRAPRSPGDRRSVADFRRGISARGGGCLTGWPSQALGYLGIFLAVALGNVASAA